LLGVMPSIKLHNQPLLEAHEINDIPTQRLLPAKFVAMQLTEAKMLP